MSLATCARRRIPSVHCFARRNASTHAQTAPSTSKPASSTPSTSSKVLSHTTLPPAKMRALVALYHQADTWITSENLLQKIDEAFVSPSNPEFFDSTQHILSYEEIEKARKAMQAAPKMAVWEKGSNAFVDRSRIAKSWSDNRDKREMKVIEALYGVVTTADARVLPGLDVVEETAAVGKGQSRGADVQDILQDVPDKL